MTAAHPTCSGRLSACSVRGRMNPGVHWYAAVILLGAMVLGLPFWSPLPGAAFAQEQQVDWTEDPAYLEQQDALEQGLEDILKQAEDLERTLAGEDAPQTVEVVEDGEASSPEEIVDARQLAVDMQRLLIGAGCYRARDDGIWGPQSRQAAADFARHTGVALDERNATPELAALLRDNYSGGRVCPLVCDARHEVRGDACVLKTCSSGKTLDRNGQCVTVRQRDSCQGYRLSQKPSRSECAFYLSVSRSGDWSRADRESSRQHYRCNCQ